MQPHRDGAVWAQQPEPFALAQHPQAAVVGAEELHHLRSRLVTTLLRSPSVASTAAAALFLPSFSSPPAVVLVAGPSVCVPRLGLLRLRLRRFTHPHARVHLGADDGHGGEIPGLQPAALDLVERVLQRPPASREVRENLRVGVEDVAGFQPRRREGVGTTVTPQGLLLGLLLLRLSFLLVATHRDGDARPESECRD